MVFEYLAENRQNRAITLPENEWVVFMAPLDNGDLVVASTSRVQHFSLTSMEVLLSVGNVPLHTADL